MYSPSTGFVDINILYTTLTVADRDDIPVTRCWHITCWPCVVCCPVGFLVSLQPVLLPMCS